MTKEQQLRTYGAGLIERNPGLDSLGLGAVTEFLKFLNNAGKGPGGPWLGLNGLPRFVIAPYGDALLGSVIRMELGHYCGYALVCKPHQLETSPQWAFVVNGGVTYTTECEGALILGMDCAHSWDITHGVVSRGINLAPTEIFGNQYWTHASVLLEMAKGCDSLRRHQRDKAAQPAGSNRH